MRVLLFALLTIVAVTAPDKAYEKLDTDLRMLELYSPAKPQDGNGIGVDIDEALSGPIVRFKRQDAYEKICTSGATTQDESTYCSCLDDGSGWQCIAMASQIKIFSLLIFGSALVSLFSASFYR